MKNYKVKALRPFTDALEKVDRVMSEEFYCTEERCKVLIEHNAVELIQVEIDEKDLKEDIENKDGLLTKEEIEELKENEVVDIVVNKSFEEKPKKKNNKKK